MKRLVFFALCLVAAVSSCGNPSTTEDPFKAAVIDALKNSNPELKSFTFTLFEVYDSTTYNREICRRANIFETKRDFKLQRAEHFKKENKPKNEARQLREAARADSIRTAILGMKETYSDRLDDILYYSFHFNGNGKLNDGSTVRVEDWYATIDRNFKVYTMQQGDRKLSQAMGAALPGYLELIASFNANENENEE